MITKLFTVILCLAAFPAFSLTGNAEAGQQKSNTCIACHGVDGNSVNPAWPKLAGQYQDYLISQLLEYKKGPEGHRNVATMYGMVANLSEQDIADLAAYYSQQKPSLGEAQADLLELGTRIYRGGNLATGVSACIACHGPTGLGNKLAGFPRLAGQNAQYIKDQLHAFKSGERSNDMNGMMRMVAQHMTDNEIEAVSSFIEGLR